MRQNHIGVVFLQFLILFSVSCNSWSQSRLPDDNNSNHYNSFEKAISLGDLGVFKDEQYNTIIRSDKLANVSTGYDSVDYFKFRVVSDNFKLHVRLSESPANKGYIQIFYEDPSTLNRVKIAEGRGNAHENFDIDVNHGVFYAVVYPSSDADLRFQYAVSLYAEPLQRIDPAGSTCKSALNVGRLTSRKQLIQGSVNQTDSGDAYLTYFESYSRLIVAVTNLRNSQYHVEIVDLTCKNILRTTDRTTVINLDPGFYYIAIVPDGCSLTRGNCTIGPRPDTDYDLKLQVKDLDRQFAPRRTSLNYALSDGFVAWFDLGTNRNGNYNSIRYAGMVGLAQPRELVRSQRYILRDWVGPLKRVEYYGFELSSNSEIELDVFNLSADIEVSILDENGNEIGKAINNGIPNDPHFATPKKFQSTLDSGVYALRLRLAAPRVFGASYQINILRH